MTPHSTGDTNHELALANDFIRQTGASVFLTGKAGTGKTTFLRQLLAAPPKRLVITAPTGVAAINAKGVTIHSFFQLPFSPFIPGTEEQNQQQFFRFSKDKRNIIRSLELLIIDEISMVRSDLLDAIDMVLKRVRRNNLPFGGVQLLLIGDLHQLPPVVKSNEQSLLEQHYNSPYFFASHALQKTHWITITLTHIYRQQDATFISLLNKVRSNTLDHQSLQILNQRYRPQDQPDRPGMIRLTTHNHAADKINQHNLQVLDQPSHRFKAKIEKHFPEYAFPTAAELELKEGAQVMFVRNDPEKRFFNGKIGHITQIKSDHILIDCGPNEPSVAVQPSLWENIQYTVNPETQAIEEEVAGTFEQYPLKLAWAITIHKSQGLTFDHMLIDAADAFSHGQVYVALSRCRSLEGIQLTSPIPANAVKTDTKIHAFTEQTEQQKPTHDDLHTAKITYQQQLIQHCFNFQWLMRHLSSLVNLIHANRAVALFAAPTGEQNEPHNRLKLTNDTIDQVAQRFQQQLMRAFTATDIPESSDYIQQRIQKSYDYFKQHLLELELWMQNIRFTSDNKSLLNDYNKHLKRLQDELTLKLAVIRSCESGFSVIRYQKALAVSQLDITKSRVKHSSNAPQSLGVAMETLQYPELFKQLMDWRTQKAQQENVEGYHILHQKVLIDIAAQLPLSKSALKKIKGIGPRTIEKYGDELLSLTEHFCKTHAIDLEGIAKATASKAPYSDTQQTSYQLFLEFKNIADVARHRGMVETTIEGHLVPYIKTGKLDIDLFLTPEKQAMIKEAIDQCEDDRLKPIKEQLGEQVSWRDIHMMRAHLTHQTEDS